MKARTLSSEGVSDPGSGFVVHQAPSPVPTALCGAVAAIGNFDGVHRGHQALLAAARDLAAPDARPVAVVTFDPHPRAWFRPGEPDFLLTPGPARWRLLAAFGADAAFVLPFDAELAATPARAFIEGRLAGELGLAGLVVGENFRFGRGREGDAPALAAVAAELGLACRVVPPVLVADAPVSSSRVRAALADGDVAGANELLGYRWFVEGEIVHGDKRGRTLGFPTANMRLADGSGLRHGIYAVRLATADGAVRVGVCSYGRRPTFDDGRPLLETYVLDWAGDLYGQTVTVEFLAWIRGEERFPSADALVARMREDEAEARSVLAHASPWRSLLV